MNEGNKLHFTKMQGLGNDYLYVFGEVPNNIKELSVRLSDRHFGAGSDGMIYIWNSDTADFSMRIFNADGSEAKMCGNGIRCVGKYVYEKGYTEKTDLDIETMSGVRRIHLHVENEVVADVSVEMGEISAAEPVRIIQDVSCIPVSAGNKHAVLFWNEMLTNEVCRNEMLTSAVSRNEMLTNEVCRNEMLTSEVCKNEMLTSEVCRNEMLTSEVCRNEMLTNEVAGNEAAKTVRGRALSEPDDRAVKYLGRFIQTHEPFSEETNVEIITPIGSNEFRMRVFEAGSGITMACGTGATAAAMAYLKSGNCSRNEDIRILLDGGELTVRINDDDTAIMTGPAGFVYEGEVMI